MRHNRRRRRKENKGSSSWLVTYSDMVTLILVFFILLFSMSQIDQVKFEAVTESFRNRVIFDFFPSPIPSEYPTDHTKHEESGEKSNDFETPTDIPDRTIRDGLQGMINKEDALNALMEDVNRFLDEHDLTNVITANRTERGVVLVLQERILFASGEAEILDSGKPFLQRISELLTEIPNAVVVEGHTDSRPISNYRYPSNWELSGARASSVIRYLIEENDFDPNRFSAVGYADTRPAVPNTSPENWQKNRRVEIIILENTNGANTYEDSL